MEYRTGKCSQCGAEYKIPASFAHNVARCKVCRGVVHVSGGAGASAGGARREARESARESARPEPREPATRAASGAPPGDAPAATAPARTPSPAAPERDLAGASRAAPAAREPAAHVAEARSGLPVPLLVLGAVLVLAAAGLFLFRARIFGAERAPAAETAAPADQ